MSTRVQLSEPKSPTRANPRVLPAPSFFSRTHLLFTVSVFSVLISRSWGRTRWRRRFRPISSPSPPLRRTSLARRCPRLTSLARRLPLASAASEAGSAASDASTAFDSCLCIPVAASYLGVRRTWGGRPTHTLPRSGNSPGDAVAAVSLPPPPLLCVQIQVPLLQIPFPSSAFAPSPSPS